MIASAGIHRRNGRILVSARAQTDVGVLVDQAPVLDLSATSPPDEIGVAARTVLDAFIAKIPHPNDWTKVRDVVTEASGAKSWSEFVRGAESCSLEVFPNYIQITPWRNAGAKRGFVGLDTGRKVVLDVNADAAELGEAILRALDLCE